MFITYSTISTVYKEKVVELINYCIYIHIYIYIYNKLYLAILEGLLLIENYLQLKQLIKQILKLLSTVSSTYC
jgi:hypothetical protein